MKNRKKWLLLGLTLALLVATTGCGKENAKDDIEKEVKEEIVSSDNNQTTASDEDTSASESSKNTQVSENNIGQFTTQDIYGETVTQDIFADYDLTLVNLFATWCGPCISEMPELSQLQKDMRDQGVNIVAVVLDASYFGVVDESAVATAQELAELVDAEFTFMIPDETNLNGRLDSVSAVPESFFVDSNGNIVGESYVGARDYDTWKGIIETELANLQGAE